jgi:hypothetical protein
VLTTVKCAVVRLRALMAQQLARLITNRPIEMCTACPYLVLRLLRGLSGVLGPHHVEPALREVVLDGLGFVAQLVHLKLELADHRLGLAELKGRRVEYCKSWTDIIFIVFDRFDKVDIWSRKALVSDII